MTDTGQAPPTLGPGEENPQPWVEYLQQMLNWFYQMQVVSQDGDFGHQTRHVVTHLRGQLGLSAEAVVDERLWKELEGSGSAGGAGGSGGVGEPVDVTVTLVTGDEETGWAAAVAMVASANNNPQTVDDVLAASPQRRRTGTEAAQLATERFGLSARTCHASQAESWAGVLRAHGALWVPVPGDDHHVIVVAGIRAEGEEAEVHVFDPLSGTENWLAFATFRADYRIADGADLEVLAGR